MNDAARHGHVELVKLLLDKGVNNYNHALDLASIANHNEIVKLIESYKSRN